MNSIFSGLSKAEYQQLKDAFALITVYIAGSDGTIDSEETAWAEKVTDIRSYKMTDDLKEFYHGVHEEFENKVGHMITNMPKSNPSERNNMIAKQLEGLNPILAKLPIKTGAKLYSGLVSFATHVAKSTGGLFGFFSISAAEKELLGLKMLTPIVDPDAEAEGEEE
jgi:hypothetical protein